MMVTALTILIFASGPAPARADSYLSFETRNSLSYHGSLAPGDELEFPKNFRLDQFSPERGLAAKVIEGHSEKGKPYTCAFALKALTEVEFPGLTHWRVSSTDFDGETQKITFIHETWGEARPLDLRCVGSADVNTVLESSRIALLERVPVEQVVDAVRKTASQDASESEGSVTPR